MYRKNPTKPITPCLVKIIAVVLAITLMAGSFPVLVNAAPLIKNECAFNYQVRHDDTLGKIAKRNAVKAVDLVRANNIKKPYTIFVGQNLCIPNISKKGLQDIGAGFRNAKAAYFIVEWVNRGVRITIYNVPNRNSYYVRVANPSDTDSSSIKVGVLNIRKNGPAAHTYRLPKELQGSNNLQVCIKNVNTNTLMCNSLNNLVEQSYAPIQMARTYY
jgi:LysM repeat protein